MKKVLKRVLEYIIVLALIITSTVESSIVVFAVTPSIEPSTWKFEYTGRVVEWVVPKTGTYHITAVGGSGGGIAELRPSGGSIDGTVKLTKGDKYYIAVGGNGSASPTGAPGGWNGGGSSHTYGASGGGATAIYKQLRNSAGQVIDTITSSNDGLLANYTDSSCRNDVMLVAGGGGGAFYSRTRKATPFLTLALFDGYTQEQLLVYERVGYYSGQWYDLENTSEFMMREDKGGYGVRVNTYYKVNYSETNTQTVGCGGTGQNKPYDSAYNVNSNYTTGGKNTFGIGADAPDAYNTYECAGAGGGGWLGGKSVASNILPATGGGGSGYINSSFGLYSYTSTVGSEPVVEITYEPENVELNINTFGYGSIDGKDDFRLTQDSETTFDLRGKLQVNDGYTLRRFEKTSGDGTLNDDIFTFGHLDTTFDVIFQTDFNIRSKYFGDLGQYLSVEATEDDNMSKKFKVEKSVDDSDYQVVSDTDQSFFSRTNGSFVYTGDVQEYIVPIDGWYKLTCWGAGGSGEVNKAAPGGMASAEYYLHEGDKLYIYVGDTFSNWNGGGNGGTLSYKNSSLVSSKGCGATDIRLIPATQGSWYDTSHSDWNTDKSLLSRLVTAGGGAGYAKCLGRQFDGGRALEKAADNTNTMYSDYPYSNSSYSGPLSNNKLGQGSSVVTSHTSLTDTGDEGYSISGGGGGGWYGGRTVSYNASGTYGSLCWVTSTGGPKSPYVPINGNRMVGARVDTHAGTSNVQSSYAYNGTTYTARNTKITDFSSKSSGKASIQYINNNDASLAYSGTFDVGDKAAPDAPEIDYSIDTGFNIKIGNNIKDNGTKYKYKFTCVDSIDETEFGSLETDEYLNISGIDGYRYYIDGISTGNVTSNNNLVKGNFTVDKQYLNKWLHIATVDKAGNISDTINVQLLQGVTIKFNANSNDSAGNMDDQLIKYDTSDNIRKCQYKRDIYKFTGWNTKANGTGDEFIDEQLVDYDTLLNKYGLSITLYAQWKLNVATIHYDKNSTTAQGSMADQQITVDEDAYLNKVNGQITNKGYKITGWTLNPDGTGVTYKDGAKVIYHSDDDTLENLDN